MLKSKVCARMDEEKFLIDRLENLEKRDKVAIARLQKYDKMTYSQVLQCPENKRRLKLFEEEQRYTFEKIIKSRHKALYSNWKDLFAEYLIDFLKGRIVCIDDFLYEDRSVPVSKRILKKLLEIKPN